MAQEESDARRAGRRALRAARAQLVQRALEQLQQRDPELAAKLTAPDADARTRLTAVETMLERSVERKPSLLGQVGLSAIQALQAAAEEAAEEQGDQRSAVRAVVTSTETTVAFTDLEGFTEFTATNGDEAASRLLAEHHRVVTPIIRGRGGRIVKRLGDGLLLTFPAPEAAALACLELVDAQPEPLRLRAGLHVGSVVVTEDDVIGHVVNLTARVAELAAGAEVLATKELCGAIGDALPGVRFGEPRVVQFKGIKSETDVCSLTWAR